MKLLALIIGVLVVQSSAPFETSFTGRVEAIGSNAPVPYAEVVLAPVGGTLDGYRTTVADTAGHFEFRNVRPGAFRVHAERQGYLRGESGSRTPGRTPDVSAQASRADARTMSTSVSHTRLPVRVA